MIDQSITRVLWVEKLRGVKRVFSHKSCPDGTGSAMVCAAAFKLLGTEPVIEFMQYGTKEFEGLVPELGHMFVDITPPRARWKEWHSVDPIVLDHHVSSRDITDGLFGMYGGPDESGTSLAYEHVMVPILDDLQASGVIQNDKVNSMIDMWRPFAHLAMIRDTWKDQDVEWLDALALGEATGFHGSQEMIESVRSTDGQVDIRGLLAFGHKLVEKTRKKAELLADGASEASYGGIKAAFYNCTEKMTSEVGNTLVNRGFDITAGYFFKKEDGLDRVMVSLRSKKGGFPVNKIAEAFKGGGHPAAAGFQIADWEGWSLRDLKRLVGVVVGDIISKDVTNS